MTVTNSTISGNGAETGGGIESIGQLNPYLYLYNSIIYGNFASDPALSDIVAGAFGAFNNLVGNAGPSGLVNGVNGNIVGATPLLGPLQNNGGPTWTMALQPGSPAINATSPAFAPPKDQRGFTRDALPDIGAYEFNATPATTPTSTAVASSA